ncbi:stage II sporulation protein P [Anaerotignum sp.]
MKKKDKTWLNIIGLVVFLLSLPLFFRMGGGQIAMAEVLPGQAETGGLSFAALFEREKKAVVSANLNTIGVDDVEFSKALAVSAGGRPLRVTAEELANMKDLQYLRSNYYIVDSRTSLLAGDIDVEQALSLDLTIKKTKQEPKVLIFHTHIHEGFADSDMSKGLSEGIWGVGEELKRILEEEYGIGVIHDGGQYDMVNGKGQTTGAYERMEPPIREILKKYPSIEVCIDLHRDGVAEGTRLVTEIDGKSTAQVMFFNGLCRLNKNGTPQPISGLENPYIKENLAFSLQMKTAADQFYPDFTRKIYLNAYRFSLHFMPRSSLVEVGAQTNTKVEAKNAMKPLAQVLASVLTE